MTTSLAKLVKLGPVGTSLVQVGPVHPVPPYCVHSRETAIWGNFLRFGLRDFKSLAICDLWFGALSRWPFTGVIWALRPEVRRKSRKGFSMPRDPQVRKSRNGVKIGNGPNTVSESTVSNPELSEFFGAHWVPGIELSEFLSAYYLCAKANSPSFLQNSPSLPQNSVSSLLRNSTLETVFRPFPTKRTCMGQNCENKTKLPENYFDNHILSEGMPTGDLLATHSALAYRNRSDFCDLRLRLRCPSRTPEIASDFQDKRKHPVLPFLVFFFFPCFFWGHFFPCFLLFKSLLFVLFPCVFFPCFFWGWGGWLLFVVVQCVFPMYVLCPPKYGCILCMCVCVLCVCVCVGVGVGVCVCVCTWGCCGLVLCVCVCEWMWG